MLTKDKNDREHSLDDESMRSFDKTVAELNKYNKVFEEVAEESQDHSANSVSNVTEELQIDSPGYCSDSYDDLTP